MILATLIDRDFFSASKGHSRQTDEAVQSDILFEPVLVSQYLAHRCKPLKAKTDMFHR